jgi:hypothetical protein
MGMHLNSGSGLESTYSFSTQISQIVDDNTFMRDLKMGQWPAFHWELSNFYPESKNGREIAIPSNNCWDNNPNRPFI